MSDILPGDEPDAATAAAATPQAPRTTIPQTPQALQAPQPSAASTKLPHKNWIAGQFIRKQSPTTSTPWSRECCLPNAHLFVLILYKLYSISYILLPLRTMTFFQKRHCLPSKP